MNDPLISVIVPVYKVEPYLDKCIRSIVEQTYSNIEIILVDDGSPDKCPEMCDKWAEKDSRIKVVHQQNRGSGAARNAAMDIALGDFICFVDSDDWIAPEMLMELVNAFAADNVDITECDFICTFDEKVEFNEPTESVHTEIFTSIDAMREHILDRRFRQIIWNKMYRRALTEGVRFPSEPGGGIDDEFFTYLLIGKARNLARIEKKLYAYRQNNNSIMHRLNPVQRISTVKARAMRHEYIKQNLPELCSESAVSVCYTCIYYGQIALKDTDKTEKNVILKELKGTIRTVKDDIVKNRISVNDRAWIELASFSLHSVCALRNMLRINV